MVDTTHLDALNLHLSHERARVAAAKTTTEKEFRAARVSQLEKEIAGELKFLGITGTPEAGMSDDELLAELTK